MCECKILLLLFHICTFSHTFLHTSAHCCAHTHTLPHLHTNNIQWHQPSHKSVKTNHWAPNILVYHFLSNLFVLSKRKTLLLKISEPLYLGRMGQIYVFTTLPHLKKPFTIPFNPAQSLLHKNESNFETMIWYMLLCIKSNLDF